MAILSRSSSNFHDQISSIKNEMSSIRAAGVGATATSTGSGTGSGDGSGSDSGSGSVSPSKRGQGVAPIATQPPALEMHDLPVSNQSCQILDTSNNLFLPVL